MPDNNSQLLRFFTQSPNFLDTPEDRELSRKRAVKAFGPRDVDEGRPSYWEAHDDVEKGRLAAHKAAQFSRLRQFNTLTLRREFSAQYGFDPRNETDPEAPECIARLHCTLDATTPEKLDAFVETVRLELLKSTKTAPDPQKSGNVSHRRYDRQEILAIFREVAANCSPLDETQVKSWVREAIAQNGGS